MVIPIADIRSILGLSFSLLLAGCALNTTSVQSPVASPGLIRGKVFGGQQPVIGATMQLYAVGVSGNGSAATPLIHSTVLTTAGGAFSINGDYTCPANALVYLTATGGNPGITGVVNNPALALVDALGPCSNLTPATNIVINEATTVAAAWALSPFTSSLTNIGATNTNSVGITNAFLTAAQLVDPLGGQSPGNVPALTVMETAKLNSLADVIAGCVNSNGVDTNCSGLFADVTPPTGGAPADTFAAALAVVKNPGNNVAAIFNNHVSASPPFPALTQAPTDWSMTITFNSGTNNFQLYAFDSKGNMWGFANNQLTELSHQLTPILSISLAPYADGYIYGSGSPTIYANEGFAIDPSDNVWITSNGYTPPGGGTPNSGGSVLEFRPSGTLVSATPGYTGGGIQKPLILAADPGGEMWVGNLKSPNSPLYNVSLLTAGGSPLSPTTGFMPSPLFTSDAAAIDGNRTAWFTSNSGQFPYFTSIANPGGPTSNPTITQIQIPASFSYAIAVDAANNVWFTNSQGPTGFGQLNMLGVITNQATLFSASITGGGLTSGPAMAIDAANHVWILNSDSFNAPTTPITLSEFSAAPSSFATPLTPSTGYGNDANAVNPGVFSTNLVVDSSGSIWTSGIIYPVSNGGSNSYAEGLTQFVGLAAPVKTPVLGPPQAP
jgi:hypothetical protein